KEVVEVDHAGRPLALLVGAVELGDALRRGRWPAPGAGNGVDVVVGPDEAGLRPLDLARQPGHLDVAPGLPYDLAEQPALPGEQGGRVSSLVGPPGAQLGPGDAVERAGRDAVAQSEATQSITQLGRGLPGEGEGEDVALVGVGGAH